LWLARQAGRRGVWLGCGLVLCGAGVAATLSPIVRARFDQTVGQFRDQFGEQRQRSIDPRLEFYRHTLTLIARHPVMGTGTGSFEPEYRALAQQHGLPSVSEPHNEYLLLTVQLGLAGGLLFGLLLWSQWRQSRQLPDWEASLVQGAVLTLAMGSLFNSLILSVTGGLFWSYLTGLGGAARHANAEPKATS
jgi:O-antigen ligase